MAIKSSVKDDLSETHALFREIAPSLTQCICNTGKKNYPQWTTCLCDPDEREANVGFNVGCWVYSVTRRAGQRERQMPLTESTQRAFCNPSFFASSGRNWTEFSENIPTIFSISSQFQTGIGVRGAQTVFGVRAW